jgi:hypothetical protein
LEDYGIDGRMLKCNFRKWDVGAWTVLIWPEKGQVVGSCKCGNEPSGSTKFGEFD